uniref:Uncharacterized protein n=1 Tax=Ditylenchus dipsaci TaxID=166011 RepID=A0A915DIC9_9BILA
MSDVLSRMTICCGGSNVSFAILFETVLTIKMKSSVQLKALAVDIVDRVFMDRDGSIQSSSLSLRARSDGYVDCRVIRHIKFIAKKPAKIMEDFTRRRRIQTSDGEEETGSKRIRGPEGADIGGKLINMISRVDENLKGTLENTLEQLSVTLDQNLDPYEGKL